MNRQAAALPLRGKLYVWLSSDAQRRFTQPPPKQPLATIEGYPACFFCGNWFSREAQGKFSPQSAVTVIRIGGLGLADFPSGRR